MKKTSFKSFKDISDVCESLHLKHNITNFIEEKKCVIDDYYYQIIIDFFKDKGSFSSEASICERIIFPIIYKVATMNSLPVWSQLKFTVDKSLGLTGVPDYIIAPAVEGGLRFKTPIVCLGEAKKDDFIGGWGQVGSEMFAAQTANKNKNIPIFGIVSNGHSWEFGKLEKNIITINENLLVTPRELQQLLNTLNWMFCEARKNADQLLIIND